MAKFDVYANGHYLCTINHTLRVLKTAFDCERCMNAMQTMIDQHPADLLIAPVVPMSVRTRKSNLVTLAEIAPKFVRSYRRKNTKKRPTKGIAKGGGFSKNISLEINRSQREKRANSEKSKFGEIR